MNNMLLKNPPRKRYSLPDGTEVPGVTTVLGILEKPALLKWAWEGGYDCGLPPVPESGVLPFAPPPVKPKTFAQWREGAMDSTAGVGTITHYRIQCYLNGYEETYSPDYLPAHLKASDVPFKRFCDYWHTRGGSVILSEYSMVHPKLRYGGTCDLLVKCAKGFELWDVKTSKAIYDEYYIQLAGYLMLLAQEPRFRQMRIKPRIVLIPQDGRLEIGVPSAVVMAKARAAWLYLVKAYHKIQDFRRCA